MPSMPSLREELQQTLGQTYALERELGGGGMSRVYIASETALGRKVVVKVLPPEVAAGVKVERFKREIQFLARLHHPHIVPLLAAGGDGNLSWYVMPFMQGESLRARLLRRGHLPPSQVIRILREVATALSFAHQNGIVHRDVKPDNVLLVGGSTMVTDFGVAKALSVSSDEGNEHRITSLGVALGTPSYIAPEQATADPTMDHRADIYSFGAMGYEMLCGRTPFTTRSPQAMLAAHISEKPVPINRRQPEIPAKLSELIMECLEKRPDKRPQTANELIKRLDQIVVAAGDSVTPAEEPTYVAPITPSPESTRIESRVRGFNRRYVFLAIGIATVVAGLLIGRMVAASRRAPPATDEVPAPPASSGKSIGVLPLVNVSGDPANDYLSDGLSDEIMAALSKVPGLRVASRTSAFSFKGKTLDAREIGRRLNVGSLLEGSMRRDGDQLRVSVQLTNVSDNLALWTGRYERRMKDVFSVQDSISQAIVRSLALTLSQSDSARMKMRGTERVGALDLYLKGRYFVNRNNEADIRRGLAYYQQATTEDPKFARAWAGIAYAWIALADDYLPPRDAYPRAKSAATTALGIDPNLSEARAALGAVHLWYDWNTAAASRELTEAIRLDSTNVYAYRYYGNLLKGMGRFDSALTVIQKAQHLDPLSPGRLNSIALMFNTLGRFDQAIEQAAKALELDPQYDDAYLAIGHALLLQGKSEQAIDEFKRAPKMGNRMQSGIASAEAARGSRDSALAILKNLEAESQRHYVGPENIAAVYFALGDRDKGFEWLDKAYDARSAYLALLRSDRRWDSVRDDPRFVALVRKVGI